MINYEIVSIKIENILILCLILQTASKRLLKIGSTIDVMEPSIAIINGSFAVALNGRLVCVDGKKIDQLKELVPENWSGLVLGSKFSLPTFDCFIL